MLLKMHLGHLHASEKHMDLWVVMLAGENKNKMPSTVGFFGVGRKRQVT